MCSRFAQRVAALCVFMFLSTLSTSAAIIQGQVLDSTSGMLPGVTIEAVAAGDARAFVAVTDAEGRYAVTVPTGAYELSFRLLNFATAVRRDVAVEERPRIVDVTLLLASSADVVVTAKQTFRDLTELDEPIHDLLGFADTASVGVISGREIDRRPFQRPGEVLEAVPGVIVSQHSGEGKANQYYLRGFNLDHGTDIAITVAGVPVNMRTHGHGQGYADTNFLIPELVSAIQFKKGPYFADEGDFASAGAANINYVNLLEKPLFVAQGGSFGYGRALVAASPQLGGGYLLYALEAVRNDGPWERGDDLRKWNGFLRYTKGDQRGGYSITASGYDSRWDSTDQIPARAVDAGSITRFGLIDPSDGGSTSRHALAAEWQRGSTDAVTRASAYVANYKLNLFSNFTYFLDDPIDGDQFEQADDRWLMGGRASRRWNGQWGKFAAENLIGLDVRHDDIGSVGLYHTRDRERLDTVREDGVLETSGGVYAQTSIAWSQSLRTIVGLRADHYRFDVDASLAANGGNERASIVNPKLSIIYSPWRNTELYANAGGGFHSNDARGATIHIDPASGEAVDPVTPLVRTRGAELGLRSTPVPRFHATVALWGLDIASELLFVGDAGTTEASRPSRRVGVELTTRYQLLPWLIVDADYAYSRGRFRDDDPAGNRIPGAIEGVASAGLNVIDLGKLSAELRYRYFGPRPLIENDSIRSEASNLVSARIAYQLLPRLRLAVDVFNAFDSEASDIDYYYTSRLRGEPEEGIDDIHFHPVEKRAVRLALTTTF